ncbi:DNA primase large subunit eukaryotic/archaeal [Penicillium hetheringtonii]|uniref:DNA primase large subunit eukaryotic/archaeal n=1 Tax=Penicillium hetheringtonii TaxID=911720 RepID=A0AAD6DEE6_9EURO|nr:DNA primase large subunit eukaryotic/archaeal [Penicillium hetheringtonii]
MIRQDAHRIDPKRRAIIDPKKRQFAAPIYKQQDYPFRLNLYDTPPTAEITLEQFEQWAIDRLKILAEIEACSYRNKSPRRNRVAYHPSPPEIPSSFLKYIVCYRSLRPKIKK